MRLWVVAGSAPASSFSTPRDRRIAPHPPGPGLPLHAPSVKISTSDLSAKVVVGRGLSGIDAISGRAGDAAVKPQLFQIFERVLGTDQGASGLVQPIVQPGQQETQRAAARQQWQCSKFSGVEGSGRAILLYQQPRLGDIEAAIGLEAPGVEAD